MEISSSFEKLGILEEKINSVLELLKTEKELNIKLQQEKNELIARLNILEATLTQESQNLDQLNQERFLTRDVVDELIKNIDRLIDVRQETI